MHYNYTQTNLNTNSIWRAYLDHNSYPVLDLDINADDITAYCNKRST